MTHMKPTSSYLEAILADDDRATIEKPRSYNALFANLLSKAHEEIELLCDAFDELTKEVEELFSSLEDAYEQGFEE